MKQIFALGLFALVTYALSAPAPAPLLYEQNYVDPRDSQVNFDPNTERDLERASVKVGRDTIPGTGSAPESAPVLLCEQNGPEIYDPANFNPDANERELERASAEVGRDTIPCKESAPPSAPVLSDPYTRPALPSDLNKLLKVFYDPNTELALKGALEKVGRDPFPGIGFRGINCNCDQSTQACGCCSGLNISRFNFERNACTNVTFYPNDLKIRLLLIMNDREVLTNGNSNPKVPYTRVFKVLYDRNTRRALKGALEKVVRDPFPGIEFRDINCNGDRSTRHINCGYCSGLDIKNVYFERSACTNITFYPDEQKIRLRLIMNDREVLTNGNLNSKKS